MYLLFLSSYMLNVTYHLGSEGIPFNRECNRSAQLYTMLLRIIDPCSFEILLSFHTRINPESQDEVYMHFLSITNWIKAYLWKSKPLSYVTDTNRCIEQSQYQDTNIILFDFVHFSLYTPNPKPQNGCSLCPEKNFFCDNNVKHRT